VIRMYEKRILLIDDEKDFCQSVKINLERTGRYKVLTATTGKEGLKLAKKTKPDLILLDINMPNIDGFKVLENLKRETDTISIPVVILSARKDEESKLETSRLYNEGYIEKPVETSELIAEIERVLQQRDGA